jgi:hypothetical protein
MKRRILAAFIAFALCSTAAGAKHSDGSGAGLADATILIVRHAEKPDTGPGLTPAGQARAQACVAFFENFNLDGTRVRPDYLIAAADSSSSVRPRLTIEPLSQALHLKIHQHYKDRQFAELASELESYPHGKIILISWHHGEIPALINALGVNPTSVLPAPKWPPSVFGWVVVVQYDHDGRPSHEELVRENLMPDDAGQ